MNKKHLLTIAIIVWSALSANFATAQGMGVNASGSAADASAMLDVSSNSKGLLVPRMLASDIALISNPATGLLVFQTDGTPGFYYNSGIPTAPVWTSMNGGSSSNPGTIIPFASGNSTARAWLHMQTNSSGLPDWVSSIGFGSCAEFQLTGGVMDVAGKDYTAFSAPRDGTITSISAYYNTDWRDISLVGTTITITVQLYVSGNSNHIFTPVPGASVILTPALTGIVPAYTYSISNGITNGLSIPVTAQSRYMLVFSATATGLNMVNGIGGYGGAGINIK